jgi:glyoxylase-like metal-dependent hydrolase (beta-lactamase superfamily II)
VAELAQLMARVQGKVYAYVLFLKPAQIGSEWGDTDLRQSAAAIPGVKVLTDFDGIEARRFGAETSGHTLLFDRDGRLLFSGGITESRGHTGDNLGERAIEALLNNQSPTRTATFVFGCGLANHSPKGDKARCLK